jgi:hypothetical protein
VARWSSAGHGRPFVLGTRALRGALNIGFAFGRLLSPEEENKSIIVINSLPTLKAKFVIESALEVFIIELLRQLSNRKAKEKMEEVTILKFALLSKICQLKENTRRAFISLNGSNM